MIYSSIRWVAHSSGRAFFLLFVLGFGLRVATLSLLPSDQIPPNPLWETGAVAISLAENGTFADPYLIPTGPTAHMAPLWVGAMSLVYRVLGTDYLGGLVRWLLVMAITASLWASLPWVAGRLGLGREAGVLGGLAGILTLTYPSEIEPAVGLALAVILVAFQDRWKKERTGRLASILFGLALGLSLHLKPALLPVILGFLLFELWLDRGGKRWMRSGMVAVGIAVACLPWGWRNYATFGDTFFIRGNFGLELAVGNHPGAHPDIDVSSARGSFLHPRTDMEEAERVREVGERAYMKEKQAAAVGWIRENPGEFARLTVLRTLYFWMGPLHSPAKAIWVSLLTLLAGVGAWWGWPRMTSAQRGALFIPLLTYPLVYYVLAYMPRYGEPVRWILFLLAGAGIWGWMEGRGSGVSSGDSLR